MRYVLSVHTLSGDYELNYWKNVLNKPSFYLPISDGEKI
jgi:hypothetical protein